MFTEIESSVIGLVLRDPTLLGQALIMGLDRQHFNDAFLGDIFGAAARMWGKGEAVDTVAVARIVGTQYTEQIFAIRKNAPLTLNAAPMMRALIDQRRATEIHFRLADVAREITQRRPMDPLEPILEKLGDLLALSGAPGAALETVTASVALQRTLLQLEQRVHDTRAGKSPGIPSGIPALDEVTYGFQRRKMYVLGARTSVGKTTMATTIAVNAARAGHKVAIVTVEMSDTDIMEKMLSRMSKVALSGMLMGSIVESEVDRIHHVAPELDQLPIFITSVKKPKLDCLALELTRLVRVHGVELVIVDYLQQFETGEAHNKHTNSRESAKAVSVAIQSLTKELNVAMVVLSQLNREAPEDGEPDLRHIAETDQIARDADVVMFLYRFDGRHWLSVAKQRRGKTANIKLDAYLDISLFQEAARDGRR